MWSRCGGDVHGPHVQSCLPHDGSHYLNADTTAFMQFLTSDLFKDFSTLKFVIPMAEAPCRSTGPLSRMAQT